MISGGLRIQGVTPKFQESIPLITIVTAVCNGEKTLEETILSVINQTYKNIEYIIVDGASTDGTLDIIRKYESKIDYWLSESDDGVFDAMNKGIKIAHGDFIGFLNSGDFYENNACEIIAETVLQYPNSDIIYGNTNLIIPINKKRYFYHLKPCGQIDHKIRIAPLFCHQSSFERRNIFETYGRFQNLKVAGEWVHFVLLFDNKMKFLYINKTISNYLDGGLSTSAKGFKEAILYKKKFSTFKYFDYIRYIFFFLKENPVYKKIIYPIKWHIIIFLQSRERCLNE